MMKDLAASSRSPPDSPCMICSETVLLAKNHPPGTLQDDPAHLHFRCSLCRRRLHYHCVRHEYFHAHPNRCPRVDDVRATQLRTQDYADGTMHTIPESKKFYCPPCRALHADPFFSAMPDNSGAVIKLLGDRDERPRNPAHGAIGATPAPKPAPGVAPSPVDERGKYLGPPLELTPQARRDLGQVRLRRREPLSRRQPREQLLPRERAGLHDSKTVGCDMARFVFDGRHILRWVAAGHRVHIRCVRCDVIQIKGPNWPFRMEAFVETKGEVGTSNKKFYLRHPNKDHFLKKHETEAKRRMDEIELKYDAEPETTERNLKLQQLGDQVLQRSYPRLDEHAYAHPNATASGGAANRNLPFYPCVPPPDMGHPRKEVPHFDITHLVSTGPGAHVLTLKAKWWNPRSNPDDPPLSQLEDGVPPVRVYAEVFLVRPNTRWGIYNKILTMPANNVAVNNVRTPLQLQLPPSAKGRGKAAAKALAKAKSDHSLQLQDWRKLHHTRFSRILEQQRRQREEEDADDDFAIVGESVESRALGLRCPIGMETMKVPVAGALCDHLQAFDLTNFLNAMHTMKNHNKRWLCPICNMPVQPHTIEVCAGTVDILREAGGMQGDKQLDTVDQVILNDDGSHDFSFDEKLMEERRRLHGGVMDIDGGVHGNSQGSQRGNSQGSRGGFMIDETSSEDVNAGGGGAASSSRAAASSAATTSMKRKAPDNLSGNAAKRPKASSTVSPMRRGTGAGTPKAASARGRTASPKSKSRSPKKPASAKSQGRPCGGAGAMRSPMAKAKSPMAKATAAVARKAAPPRKPPESDSDSDIVCLDSD